MTLISVIIPTFNAEKEIQTCLDSLHRQSFTDFEVIICDGGSNDKTLDICTNHELTVIIDSREDHGIYDAMNRGVWLASGEWYYFLGSDDHLADATTLQEVSKFLSNDVEVILGKAQMIERSSSKVPEWYHSSTNGLLWRNTIQHQSAFYRAHLFAQGGYDLDFKVLSDYHWNLKMYLSGVSMESVDVVVANCKAQGISKDFVSELYKEEIRLKKSLLPIHIMILQYPWVWLKYLWKRF